MSKNYNPIKNLVCQLYVICRYYSEYLFTRVYEGYSGGGQKYFCIVTIAIITIIA